MRKPVAHISVDLDPIDTHLAGYGIASAPCDLIYRAGVPRILEVLDRVGLRATLFVVARDAEREASLWQDIVGRGHELASHSVTHPIPFATLPRDVVRRELCESRARLEAVVGRPIVGFRAPGWDVDQTTLGEIARAGYLYDASVLPSPAVLAGAVLRWVLSAGRMRSESLTRTLRFVFSRRLPYRLAGAGNVWEFPVAVSPWLRVPFTHTLWHLVPASVCRRTYRAIRRAGASLCYQFHPVDLLDLEGDRVDPRMARHPGMRAPLARKTALLEGFLREIARDYEVVPYADVVAANRERAASAVVA
ncbi:MAG TPA: polysaccharide deacetylase family protein [Candidatus Kryptonia bacterium]|nr:polysaccharide deacetylase family protein [Candidatus Kryptonia bacterium]